MAVTLGQSLVPKIDPTRGHKITYRPLVNSELNDNYSILYLDIKHGNKIFLQRPLFFQDEVINYVKHLCHERIRPKLATLFKDIPDLPLT